MLHSRRAGRPWQDTSVVRGGPGPGCGARRSSQAGAKANCRAVMPAPSPWRRAGAGRRCGWAGMGCRRCWAGSGFAPACPWARCGETGLPWRSRAVWPYGREARGGGGRLCRRWSSTTCPCMPWARLWTSAGRTRASLAGRGLQPGACEIGTQLRAHRPRHPRGLLLRWTELRAPALLGGNRSQPLSRHFAPPSASMKPSGNPCSKSPGPGPLCCTIRPASRPAAGRTVHAIAVRSRAFDACRPSPHPRCP